MAFDQIAQTFKLCYLKPDFKIDDKNLNAADG